MVYILRIEVWLKAAYKLNKENFNVTNRFLTLLKFPCTTEVLTLSRCFCIDYWMFVENISTSFCLSFHYQCGVLVKSLLFTCIYLTIKSQTFNKSNLRNLAQYICVITYIRILFFSPNFIASESKSHDDGIFLKIYDRKCQTTSIFFYKRHSVRMWWKTQQIWKKNNKYGKKDKNLSFSIEKYVWSVTRNLFLPNFYIKLLKFKHCAVNKKKWVRLKKKFFADSVFSIFYLCNIKNKILLFIGL